MDKKIYEDKYYQDSAFRTARNDVNTKQQIERAEFYLSKYRTLKAEFQEELEEYEKLQKLYRCERDKTKETDINSFDPIILPIIEGQAASMTEKNISASIKGEGYSDQNFAHTGQILTDFAYRNIKLKPTLKEAVRRYLLFGNAVLSMNWDSDALDGFGLPMPRAPQLGKVFIDGKIKSMLDADRADFIIEEMGSFSIMEARREYGDDIANVIQLGNIDTDYDAKPSEDDMYSYTKLHIWTRNNEEENLQLIEMSLCGVILRESDSKEPYHKYVYNKYPYWFIGLYPQEGKFWRFGDGRVLERMQELINNLWDECVIACKFSAQATTFIDPTANCDPDQFDGDPSHPVIARNPNQTIRTVQGNGLNPIVMSMISLILQEVQRITRFSVLMSGNAPGREITATQSGIMMQQGNSGIDDKRNDISFAIGEMTKYMLGMMMEYWPAAKAIRITEDSDEVEWVDARQLKEIPAMVPADGNYSEQWKTNNPDAPVPQYMQLENSLGEPQTKSAVFDVSVSIGEGIPTSKMALYSIILGLSKLQLPDENTGMPRPLLTFQQVQGMMQDLLGIPLKDAAKEAENIMGKLGIGNTIGQNQNVATMQQPQQQGSNPYIEGSGNSGLMSNQAMGAM